MSVTRRARAALLAGTCALVLAGCRKHDDGTVAADAEDPALLAEDGTDAVTAEVDAAVVTSSLVSATAVGGSLSLASSDLAGGSLGRAGVGDGARAVYFPAGCLVVTSDDATKTITYAFKNCAGPTGIFRLTGTIVVTHRVTDGKLVLDIVGNDLVVNRSNVDWSAHAEIRADGAAREMTWHGSYAGTTARGKDFQRTDDKTLSWRFGERCFAVAGVSEGQVRDRYRRTESNFRRCQGSCPEAGGRIAITNANAKLKVEILYDGTSRATYTTPKSSSSVDLACKG